MFRFSIPTSPLLRSIPLTMVLFIGVSACEPKGETEEENTATDTDIDDEEDFAERCGEYAESVYDDCIDDGNDEEECEEHAEEAYEECVEDSEEDDCFASPS